jgi:hypothetical protein
MTKVFVLFLTLKFKINQRKVLYRKIQIHSREEKLWTL